jgi:Kef-type K+ transport system membrane component KefB
MNELTSLGLILLLALLAGHLVRVMRIPEVTGYLLAGMALGPSALGWLSHDNLIAIGLFSEVALGLILFSVGSIFELSVFRRIGRQVVLITGFESILAAVVVTAGVLAQGQSWQLASLLGAIAIATAPASTLMVVRECDSAGPLTDNLLGIIAVNNLLCIAAFSFVASAIDLAAGFTTAGNTLDTIYRSGFMLAWQLAGSAALGCLIGILLALWSSQVTENGEMLILLAGSMLLCVGAARFLELSPLVASLAVGATMVNFADRSRHLFQTLAGTDPPFYAIFFVLAGAELNPQLIPAIGGIGLTYLLGRAAGKFVGASMAARWLRLQPTVRRYLGFGLLAQAGLAVGLTLTINARYPEWAATVSAVVLGSVVVYEMIGPISTRFALMQAGEVGLAANGAPAVSEFDSSPLSPPS